MQCVVTGGNVKVLAKAVHSLSRIGDELYVEPQEDGLALRSVNSSRSAYACFLFAPLFFSRYSIDRGLDFRCKLAVKSVQTVFRSVATLEKTVEKCHVELDKAKDRLTFTLHCKHGLLKTHNLSYQDTESLQAVFDKDSCANVFRAQSRAVQGPAHRAVSGCRRVRPLCRRRAQQHHLLPEGAAGFAGVCGVHRPPRLRLLPRAGQPRGVLRDGQRPGGELRPGHALRRSQPPEKRQRRRTRRAAAAASRRLHERRHRLLPHRHGYQRRTGAVDRSPVSRFQSVSCSRFQDEEAQRGGGGGGARRERRSRQTTQ
ncbi:cell cycle checkpoint control protein RAD9A isoform X2 [Kryptolebias marmoratus]|uniref:cell cycle checkpoint control protein RAD9A isoform X2 n=1 Tax=Kryptolebias marmoratus TaxID=37003 RepID=UPI0007F90F5A|nr:cell cycle checkpoint control protein RAD9A isoform X2 [Kryptolebias marmoratus]